ncbi:MAG: chemotaxis protein CheW [Amphiplicatus sp.]
MSGVGFQVSARFAEAILDKRTAALARTDRATKPRLALPVCLLAQGGARYALPLSALTGVVPAGRLGALPVDAPQILGALFERNVVWLVYSLPKLLGGAQSAEDGVETGFFVLLKSEDRRAALCVEDVEGTSVVDLDSLSAIAPANSSGDASFIRGATADGVMLIDKDALMRRLSKNKE